MYLKWNKCHNFDIFCEEKNYLTDWRADFYFANLKYFAAKYLIFNKESYEMMDVVSVVLYIPFESHNSAALRESYQFAFNLHLIKLVMPLIFLYLSGFRFIFWGNTEHQTVDSSSDNISSPVFDFQFSVCFNFFRGEFSLIVTDSTFCPSGSFYVPVCFYPLMLFLSRLSVNMLSVYSITINLNLIMRFWWENSKI